MALLTVLILLSTITTSQMCNFPAFLQTRGLNNTMREWHSHITYHGRDTLRHYSLATFFYDDRMRVLPYGGQRAKDRPVPNTRECIMQITQDKFLSRYMEEGKEPLYLCMEFLPRSPYVFQLMESNLSTTEDPNLCKEMMLNNWIYVNKADYYTTYTQCPLSGGFNIRLYDKQDNAGICDGFDGQTRVEIDCIKGEGMTFLYRHSMCVPSHVHMHITQSTYCVGNWQHGDQMFTVLRHNNAEHLWCLRYPANHTGQFTAYLFKNLYCDSTTFPEGNEYVVIDMVTDLSHGLDNLCIDDYQGCSYWSSCGVAGHIMQLTCAKKCGVCSTEPPGKRPYMCTIPEVFRGSWHVSDNKDVFIGEEDMRLADDESMNCVEWNTHKKYTSDAEYIEQMFVSTFENGCRPRYYCAQLKKHSPSVLRFKMSHGQLWPFEGTNGINIGCAGFHYKDDHDPFINKYHSKYFKTLISQEDTVYVNCNLGPEKRFEVIFNDGTKCRGKLSQDGLRAVNKMKLTLYGNCKGRQTEQEFACLDSTKHMRFSQQLIVTETLDSLAVRIKCWVFPTYPEDLFYLLSIGDCHEGAHEKVNNKLIKPIATFQIVSDLHISIVQKDSSKSNNKQTSSSSTAWERGSGGSPNRGQSSPQSISGSYYPTYYNDARGDTKSSHNSKNPIGNKSSRDVVYKNTDETMVELDELATGVIVGGYNSVAAVNQFSLKIVFIILYAVLKSLCFMLV